MSLLNQRPCSVDDCDKPVASRGWCNKHYKTWKRNGNPLVLLIRPSGTGTIESGGYIRCIKQGARKLEHVRVAEQALGHALPPKAEVHHVDEDGQNNTPTNLVICPDKAYHKLLHRRMRAYAACGHYDWCKCAYCKQYDAPENLRFYSQTRPHHAQCNQLYQRKKAQA